MATNYYSQLGGSYTTSTYTTTKQVGNDWYYVTIDPYTNQVIQSQRIPNQSQTNPKPMSNVKSAIKQLFRKEPEATLVKAGFMDENENLTEDGRDALTYLLVEEHKAKLKELADKILAEKEKNSKK